MLRPRRATAGEKTSRAFGAWAPINWQGRTKTPAARRSNRLGHPRLRKPRSGAFKAQSSRPEIVGRKLKFPAGGPPLARSNHGQNGRLLPNLPPENRSCSVAAVRMGRSRLQGASFVGRQVRNLPNDHQTANRAAGSPRFGRTAPKWAQTCKTGLKRLYGALSGHSGEIRAEILAESDQSTAQALKTAPIGVSGGRWPNSAQEVEPQANVTTKAVGRRPTQHAVSGLAEHEKMGEKQNGRRLWKLRPFLDGDSASASERFYITTR